MTTGLAMGEVFRYSRPYDPQAELIDGLPNYFYRTATRGCKLPLLDSGINPIQKVETPDGFRCPAILISSSPHKIGSPETPWQDFFDPDHGRIRYFGDNKTVGTDPSTANGNTALLEQFALHTSPHIDKRRMACPIIFFKRVAVDGRAKGNVKFQGFGVVSRAERVTQYERHSESAFSNYVFEFVVFDMSGEHELFDWDWISARRSPHISAEATLHSAPSSWKRWVREGASGIELCRRRVVKLLTIGASQQKPSARSREESALREIYAFYDGRKSRFEALAAAIAAHVIRKDGHHYHEGWVTPSTSDGGADFIGRLDVGTGFGSAKMIVLGQAKCETLDSPTGGNHIARTVARLKRGWMGVYVTTSFFSEAVQREVLEDKYPVLLINGLLLAQEVLAIAHETGFPNIQSLLKKIDGGYESTVKQRDPEEILYD
jgi:hypothetical protein